MNILRYTDKRVGDEEKIPGFATLFKQAEEKNKLFGWFKTASISTPEEWVLYVNEIRMQGRSVRKKVKREKTFYRLLKVKSVWNNGVVEENEYFYCIPRGFTKSEALGFENDFEGEVMQTLEGKKYRFSKTRKLTEGIGMCVLEAAS